MGVFDYRGWNCHMIRRLGGFTIDLVSIAEVSKLCGMKASYTISEFKTMYFLISNRNIYPSHKIFDIYQFSLSWDVAKRNAMDYIDKSFGSAPSL